MGTTAEQFWSRVRVGSPQECWPWLGPFDDVTGYGRAPASVVSGEQLAHRVAYSLEIGWIHPRFVIDHVWERGCRDKLCCNPRHLEAVTQAENVRRYHAAKRIQGKLG